MDAHWYQADRTPDRLQWMLCSASRRLYLFVISPTANHKLPCTRPPLACQSPPWGDGLERERERRKRTKASKSEGGWIGRWGSRRESVFFFFLKPKTKQEDETLERAEHVESSPSVDPLSWRDEWMGSGTPQRKERGRVTNQQCDSLLKV